MRKRIILVLLALITATTLLGCSSKDALQNTSKAGSESSENAASLVIDAPELDESTYAESARDESDSEQVEAGRKAGYVLPDSDTRVYSTAELDGLSDDELFYARNELFARHGARFEDPDLAEYFSAKSWYRAIEPKIDEYGSEILNLVESTNAATLRRIELQRGSSHVNELNPKRAEMFGEYHAKAEEYRGEYGACAFEDRDECGGLTGLCLVQLVDFDGDGQEELLLASHDGGRAPTEGLFNPANYRVEVWSYKNGTLTQVEEMGAPSTQSASSYLILNRAGKGYELGSEGSSDGGLLYYFMLSQSHNPSSGDQYWHNAADISFGFNQMQAITSETLATLSTAGGAIGK